MNSIFDGPIFPRSVPPLLSAADMTLQADSAERARAAREMGEGRKSAPSPQKASLAHEGASQEAFAKAWKESIEQEKADARGVGTPRKYERQWPEYKKLFEKRGELTLNDMSVMTDRKKSWISAAMSAYIRRGLVEKQAIREGVVFFLAGKGGK